MLKLTSDDIESYPGDVLRELGCVADAIAQIFIDDREQPELSTDCTYGICTLLDALSAGIKEAGDHVSTMQNKLNKDNGIPVLETTKNNKR